LIIFAVSLNGCGKSNAVLSKIKLCVELANKDIAQDPEVGVDVGKAGHAVSGAFLAEDADVGGGGQLEDAAAQVEAEHGQGINCGAVNIVITIYELSPNELIQHVVRAARTGQKGGACICNSLTIGANNNLTHGCVGHVELPITLLGDGHIGEITSEEVIIDATEHQLTSILGGGISGQIEAKGGLINQALVIQIIEWWNHLILGNGCISHAQNTIEWDASEAAIWLGNSLAKCLILYGQTIDVDRVRGEESG